MPSYLLHLTHQALPIEAPLLRAGAIMLLLLTRSLATSPFFRELRYLRILAVYTFFSVGGHYFHHFGSF
jgi:hypothetical protein